MPKEKYAMTPADAVNVVRAAIFGPEPWAKFDPRFDRTDATVALAVLSQIAAEYDGFECHDPLEETESEEPLTIKDMARSVRYWRGKAASLYNVARLSRVRAAILDALRGAITVTNPADKAVLAPAMRSDDSLSMTLCAASDIQAFSVIDAWLHDGEYDDAETEMIHLHAMLSTAMINHRLSPHDAHGGIDISIPGFDGFGLAASGELCVVKGPAGGGVTIWGALTEEEFRTFGHERATTAEDAFLRIIARIENHEEKYIPDDYATRYADRRRPWERREKDLAEGTVPSDAIPSVGDEDEGGAESRAEEAAPSARPAVAFYPEGVCVSHDGKEYSGVLSMKVGPSIGWDAVTKAPSVDVLSVSAEDRAIMDAKLTSAIEEVKSSAADEGRKAAAEEVTKFLERYGKIMDILGGMGGGGYGG